MRKSEGEPPQLNVLLIVTYDVPLGQSEGERPKRNVLFSRTLLLGSPSANALKKRALQEARSKSSLFGRAAPPRPPSSSCRIHVLSSTCMRLQGYLTHKKTHPRRTLP